MYGTRLDNYKELITYLDKSIVHWKNIKELSYQNLYFQRLVFPEIEIELEETIRDEECLVRIIAETIKE